MGGLRLPLRAWLGVWRDFLVLGFREDPTCLYDRSSEP